MIEFTSTELDLMSRAYWRACDKLLELDCLLPDQMEAARLRLVDEIVEAVKQGAQDETFLVFAALSKLGRSGNVQGAG